MMRDRDRSPVTRRSPRSCLWHRLIAARSPRHPPDAGARVCALPLRGLARLVARGRRGVGARLRSLGLWHGVIAPVAWIVSLLHAAASVAIYAVPNNGGW